MLIVWFFVYKKLAQFAVRGALPPRRSESPGCAADNKPSCVLHLLGSFIGSRGFSSLEQRPEFWVLQYIQYWKTETLLHRLIDDSPFSFVMSTFSYHEYSSKVWFVGFPDSSVGKESACKAGDLSLIPGSGRSPGEGIGFPLQYSWSSLVAQLGKNLPVMQETWVRSLGWEDPLEKGKATHSSIHEYSSKVWFVEVV